MRTEFTRLLKLLRKTHPDEDIEVVRRAYRMANKAHRDQLRLSGEPYVIHCLAVAKILAQLGLDVTTVAAGLIHDVLEDTPVTPEELRAEFGDEIAILVDGVTKIGSYYMPQVAQTQEEKQAINVRKMLVATAKDVRVILIKLADRLHNMRTIEHLPEEKRLAISRETRDLYAPLADRLGIANWKWELEDHAFHQLHPKEYKDLAARVAMKRREREKRVMEVIEVLEKRLAEAEVDARVIGRPKHLYSIYQKMLHQAKDFDQVMDIVAVRIITQTVAGCYNALGVVHQMWLPIPGRFKDYIAMPKANMYQSIHTVVMGETGQPLEIQIRTEEMDRTAREGIAAHWVYKEGKRLDDGKLTNQLQWLRTMYEWLKDAQAPDQLMDSLRRDVKASELYVFTPKGEVKELPNGSTPLDFAYAIHSELGHHCIGARVNGRLVPLRYNLQNGDVVEILTSKSQTPHLDWLEIVLTGKARTRIRQRLRELGVLEPLDGQLRRDAITILPEAKPKKITIDASQRANLIRVDGKKGIAVTFAKCCDPVPGDAIIGYATKSPGISVHRADCKMFVNSKRDPARLIEVSWEDESFVQVGLRVVLGQRPNVLADITNAIRPMNVSITKAEFTSGANGDGYFDFVIETHGHDSVSRIERTLMTVPGVKKVTHRPAAS